MNREMEKFICIIFLIFPAERADMKKKITCIVYSTAKGRMCPSCNLPAAECICGGAKTSLPGDGIVRVRREAKGRGGKIMTVISGIPLDTEEIHNLAAQLKRKRGTGGAIRNNAIEIQGDHVEWILAELSGRGMNAKRAGG